MLYKIIANSLAQCMICFILKFCLTNPFICQIIVLILRSLRGINKQEGRMAEWLGRGLQNLPQRFESASDLVLLTAKRFNKMGVTRLKRKDRRNKTVSRVEVQFLKLGRNIELGSKSQMPKDSQITKNDAILNQLASQAK